MKFSLTKNKKVVYGITLYQIKAESNFGNVSKGDLGGWVEKKENLSEYGGAWVYGDAQVYGDAWVYGNARVYGGAWVYGDAQVYGNAWVYGGARVYGDAWVNGGMKISLGYFFGFRKTDEKLTMKELGDGYKLIGKGDCKFGEEEEEEEVKLSGKKVKVTLDGKEFTATID